MVFGWGKRIELRSAITGLGLADKVFATTLSTGLGLAVGIGFGSLVSSPK